MSQPTQKQGAVVRIDPKFRALSQRLRTAARQGPAVFSKFVQSPEFKRRFDELEPVYWRRAMKLVDEIEPLALKRDPLPAPVAPKPLGEHRQHSWADPAERARLAAIWAKTGDLEKTARLMGVTAGSARLALKRYVGVSATSRAA